MDFPAFLTFLVKLAAFVFPKQKERQLAVLAIATQFILPLASKHNV